MPNFSGISESYRDIVQLRACCLVKGRGHKCVEIHKLITLQACLCVHRAVSIEKCTNSTIVLGPVELSVDVVRCTGTTVIAVSRRITAL